MTVFGSVETSILCNKDKHTQSEYILTGEGRRGGRLLSCHLLYKLFLRCIFFFLRLSKGRVPLYLSKMQSIVSDFNWPLIESYESHYTFKNMITLIHIFYVFSLKIVSRTSLLLKCIL